MDAIYLTIGGSIREARLRRGQTLEELAHDAGLTTSFVGQIERGERKLSVDALSRLATALDLPVARLLEPRPLAAAREDDPVSGLVSRLSIEDRRLLASLLKIVLKHRAQRAASK